MHGFDFFLTLEAKSRALGLEVVPISGLGGLQNRNPQRQQMHRQAVKKTDSSYLVGIMTGLNSPIKQMFQRLTVVGVDVG